MGKYLEQCEKCGDETITYGWYPERCPFCELAEARNQRDTLADAAQAVVDRWDAPTWKELESTAKLMIALRKAIANVKGGSND